MNCAPGIWIDADSCPRQVRAIVEKACLREGLTLTYVANRKIPQPRKSQFQMVVVEEGDQSADNYLVDTVPPGDLVITRDIPLAADLVEKQVLVLNDRGDQFTPENIRERLSVRDFMYEIRNFGLQGKDGLPFGPREVQAFANTFDRVLRKRLRLIIQG